MASVAFNKFNCFVADMGNKVHDLNADELMVLLTNTAPSPDDTSVNTSVTPMVVGATSNAAEITAQNGYTSGGIAPTNSGYTQTSGVAKLILQPITWTASGGNIGPFRYAILYNNTAGTAAARPVIGWYDYGSSVTASAAETIDVPFDTTNGVLTNQ